MMTNKQSIQFIFALKVKTQRQKQHLSFADLAQKTGLSLSYLNEIEKGKKYPKADKIILLAEALNVSYDWLVSLKVEKKYTEIAHLIRSNLLDELPLEQLGIPTITLLELVIKSPDQFAIFIHLIRNYTQNHHLSRSKLYQSILRAHQEMQKNNFQEMEYQAEKFLQHYELFTESSFNYQTLIKILTIHFSCLVNEHEITKNRDLQSLYSIYQADKNPEILLNAKLPERQKMTELSRELGYQYLKLHPRVQTAPWFEINSFGALWNHHQASYFANAIRIPRINLKNELAQLLHKKNHWNEENLTYLLDKYRVSVEILLQRITNILDKELGIHHFFYLHLCLPDQNEPSFNVEQEMYISMPNAPYSTNPQEHYCRRWVSISLIYKYLELQKLDKPQNILCGVQIAEYAEKQTYLCLSVAFTNPITKTYQSITLGMPLDAHIKKMMPFWEDIPITPIHTTCERCEFTDCTERVVEAHILKQDQEIMKLKKALGNLQNRY